MRSFIPLAAAALLSTASAAPGWADWMNPGKCLNARSAQDLVNGFGSLLSNYSTATAEKLLADDLVDWSDSINELAGQPLGQPTFPNKAAFEAGQGSQPAIPFNLMAIDAVTCDTIALRWNTTLPPNTVKGITILKAENSQGQADTWQIKTIYTEFNSIAWLEDIGGNCTAPPQH